MSSKKDLFHLVVGIILFLYRKLLCLQHLYGSTATENTKLLISVSFTKSFAWKMTELFFTTVEKRIVNSYKRRDQKIEKEKFILIFLPEILNERALSSWNELVFLTVFQLRIPPPGYIMSQVALIRRKNTFLVEHVNFAPVCHSWTFQEA